MVSVKSDMLEQFSLSLTFYNTEDQMQLIFQHRFIHSQKVIITRRLVKSKEKQIVKNKLIKKVEITFISQKLIKNHRSKSS